MAKHKRSLFERITGNVEIEEEEVAPAPARASKASEWSDEGTDAQLTVDVYQTPSEIVIQTMVAGVRPEDLDVDISRDMVTLKGTRHKHHEVSDDDFYSRELYWGTFSRSILLPQEVEVEKSEAGLKNGLLTIRLPKLNKEKKSTLKVKLL
jgi:HSP20 family protein